MEFVKDLGIRIDDKGRRIRWSLFRCPICGNELEKQHQYGIKQFSCSNKCGVKKSKETRDKKQYVNLSVVKTPAECKGCGYWREKTGCDFAIVHKRSRVAFLNGRTCREAGIYTTKRIHGNQRITLVTNAEKRGEKPKWQKQKKHV
jgi:hypothetical protein